MGISDRCNLTSHLSNCDRSGATCFAFFEGRGFSMIYFIYFGFVTFPYCFLLVIMYVQPYPIVFQTSSAIGNKTAKPV